MSISPSSDSRDVIDDYIIVIDSCRAEELGNVCKAFDSQLRTPSRYVALLRLHDWCRHLPTAIQKNLESAVIAAQLSKYTTADSKVSCCAITCVLGAQLFGKVLALDSFTNPVDNLALHNVDYVVTEWLEELSVLELFTKYIKTPTDALAYIYQLANQLRKLYAASPYLRPEISIEQIWRKAESSDGVDGIVLRDWGFATVLDKAGRTALAEQEDVNRLSHLLLQLLDGCWLQAVQTLPADRKALSHDLADLQHKYGEQPAHELWQILADALVQPAPLLSVKTLADKLKAFDQLAKPLQSALDNRPKPSVSAPDLPQPKLPSVGSGSQLIAQATAVVAQVVDPYDKVILSYPRERQVLEQRLVVPPPVAKSGPNKYSDIFVIGQGVTERSIPGKADPLPADDHQMAQFFAQRKIYIQRHKSNYTDHDYYFTLADLGYTGDRNSSTKVDGVKLSPLFAALITPASLIEIDGEYQLKLELAAGTLTSGWTAAKANGAVALVAERQRLTVVAGMQSIDLPLQVTNPSTEVDRLTVVADGLPADWPLPQSQQVRLFDKAATLVTMSLQIPTLRFYGTYQVIVRLISDNVSAQVAAVAVQLDVPPHYDFVGFLQPETLRVGAIGELEIQNKGNLQQDFFISLRDKTNELLFEPPEMLVAIQARQAGVVSYHTHVRQWRLLGREKVHEISAVVAPQNGGVAQTFSGQIRSRAIIPAWVPILALVLMIGLFLIFSLLFIPEFVQAAVKVNEQTVDAPIAGDKTSLHWTSLNSCFYSVYQNDQALVWRSRLANAENGNRKANKPKYTFSIPRANADDRLELRLHGCTLWNTKSWQVTVLPAPTATFIPGPQPVIRSFDLHVTNVDIPRVNERGELVVAASAQPAVPQLLLGQVGELCLQWNVGNKEADDGYTIQLDPLPTGFDANVLAKAEGNECLPIAQTFQKAQDLRFTLSILDETKTAIASLQKLAQIYAPLCTVNTGLSLLAREGPGRDFPSRGELQAGSRVLPLGRPFFPYEQAAPERWVQVTLPSDPRPVWVAYDYLYCPVDIYVLPDVGAIPPTPTPLPTETPQPTATPTPELKPEITIMPEVISLGGCAIFKWKIQNVRSVYLNEEGVVGEAEKTVCPTETGQLKYTWKIENPDGTILPIERTLIVNPTGAVAPIPTPPE